jgi:hypothetical protein
LRDAPNADHVEHPKKDPIQTGQYFGIVNDLVDSGEPFDKAILGGQGGFPLPLTQSPDDGHDDIGGDSVGRVQVLDQGGDTGLVQLGLLGGELDQGAEVVGVQAAFKGMAANDIDDGGNLGRSLLCRSSRRCMSP